VTATAVTATELREDASALTVIVDLILRPRIP
jgi:hypothetical protein